MRHILFEDHTWRGFRPIAWTIPTFEIRCGLFNTRERLELATGLTEGLALCRDELAALQTAPGWLEAPGPLSGRTLWVNGRLAPSIDLLKVLADAGGVNWALRDEHGLVAAAVDPALGNDLLAAWRNWQATAWAGTPWQVPAAVAALPGPDLRGEGAVTAVNRIWDLVPATAGAIVADLRHCGQDRELNRWPFGLFGGDNPPWCGPGHLRPVGPDGLPGGVHVTGTGGIHLGSGGVELAPGTHLDTTAGPIVLDCGVRVMPHVYLAGPLYIGRDSIVKPGARIFGESSFGIGNRLAGEIGESTFGDFTNKQHDGFIGHAVLGSWVNLGALTTCSDLKNNYGSVRVDQGDGEVDTGLRFVGLMMGDHAKTAIGSLFNTGTCVGVASNIFGVGMPPKHVPGFSWGGAAGAPVYDGARAAETAAIVLGRRGCRWTPGHENLYHRLSSLAAGGK